ncbi:hypothetical protein [Roseomonas fluvialis]|uniref:Sulfotransferase family protein n=1 Tax=Roseomonas fluvialis TaxID=1750527 RepID=A0ABN6P0W5_9PROT|nr:hypothetical protein [Roseomonas fluvialis]BDG71940.1 hypothetical protein Rmf_18690 [Roseomonas fluvialis]
MTRVVIHIGSHKTGTTYLQRGFVALRPDLRAAGIDYPVQWQDHLHGHHSLVRLLAAGDAETPARLAVLAGEAGHGGRALLLSSENFEDIEAAAIGRLASALHGHQVEIVYFLRRWQGLVPSAWQEAVKQGGSETFPQFLLAHMLRLADSPLLNPGITLGRFAEAFGRQAIRLVAYDRLVEQGEELLGFFLRAVLGVAVAPPEQAGRINRALPPADVEIIRALNAAAQRSPDSLPGGVWPMRLFFELGRHGLPAIATLRRVMAQHVTRQVLPTMPALRAVERDVIARFGPALPGDVPEAAPAEAEHVAGTYWMEPSVPAAFAELRAAIRQTHAEAALAA